MADYAAARPYFEQALAIRRKILGEKHPTTANSLNNLGALLKAMGDYAAARPYLEQALAINRKIRGEGHLYTARSLNNMGSLLEVMGDYAAARPYYEQALAIRQKVLGEEHPDTAISLFSLGSVLQAIGDHAAALSYYEQTLAIYRKALGEEHLRTALIKIYLGTHLDSTGDDAGARPYYEQALATVAKQVEAMAVAQNETGQLLMSGYARGFLDFYVSFLLRVGDGDAEAYRAVLNWKGATLVRQRAARMVANNEELAPLFAELQGVIRQWSALSTAPPQADPRWQERLAALAQDKDRLELALSRQSAAFRAATAKVEIAELQAVLPEGAVLIDYFEFLFKKPGQRDRRSLAAFVMRANGEVEMFDLGTVGPIAQAIDAWRLGHGAGADAGEAGRLLREKLWTPLKGAIGDAKLVLVSPDGALGKLPFAALPGAKPDTYLIEDVAVALVPVAQLIPTLVAGGDDRAFDHELLLVGGVDYDRRDVGANEGNGSDGTGGHEAGGAAPPPVGDLWAVARSRGSARQTAEGQSWSLLPGTSDEAAAIGQLFGAAEENVADAVALLSGAAATEERFRLLAPRSRILHVATHGFFAAEGPATALAGVDPNQSAGDLLGVSQSKPPRFSPGLLSGLVLAGANAPPELPDDPAEYADLPEDGILTAEELMFLPLNDVKLVVLSACETGLGEVAGGEGLLGIQRAFQVAGARTTVASLWKVDDQWTQRLMAAFYRHAMEDRMTYLEALRSAQLEILRELRAQETVDLGPDGERGADAPARWDGAQGSPYYWAAFTLSGDWR